jgi:5-methylcytosine-specific restriction endonuclease McrA
MKTCTKCKIEKPFTEFNKDSAKACGLEPHCKNCKALYRAANKEKRSKYNALYAEANKDEIRQKKAKHRAKNRESISAQKAEYRSKNRKMIQASGANYRANNKCKIRAKSSAYYAKRPDVFAQNERNRRARKSNAEGRHTALEIQAIFDRQRGICANCKAKLRKESPGKYHVDHIMPLARGGSNWPSNLQCLCPKCNLSKNAKDPIIWAQENGRLI